MTRRARWPRTRGAALVETAVLAPILILTWIGIDYFRASYARRMHALSVAYDRAWTRAFALDGSCQRASGDGSPEVVHQLLGGMVKGPMSASVNGAIDLYVATRPAWAFHGGHVETQVDYATRGARWGGGAQVSATRWCRCPTATWSRRSAST